LNRQKAISILVVLVLVAGTVAAFVIAPKRYTVGQSLTQTVVFWNDYNAFLFLDRNTTGRSRNILQGMLAGTPYGYFGLLLTGDYTDFSKHDIVAYHLVPSGQLDRFPLPEHTAIYGAWGLSNGWLQLTPPAAATGTGFRWDGEAFVSVQASSEPKPQPASPAAASSNLKPDDLGDEDRQDEDSGFLDKAQRKQFKDAGWHYKFLSSYEGGGTTATLPIEIGGNTFNLTIQSFAIARSGRAFDFLAMGTKSIQISGKKLASGPQTLWSQSGWQEASKEDYQRLQQQYGHPRRRVPLQFTWLFALLALLLWRFGSWIHILFTFATMKRRVLKSMATSYSFPPATPAQFPQLDLESLDRYTREFEGMGFTRLLDFSLVSDSSSSPPSFCRLFAHTRHHCFAEVNQIFPKNKLPLPLKCSLQCCLQDGWTLAFANRKPQAASSLMRRRKAIGVCMPEATASELLQSLLKMREQICLDLGIQTVNDDTLEAYIAKVQRSATDMREAVQEKNFVKGVPQVYLRKFALLKTKPEYIWLGDYPKEADQRKQGFNTFAAGTH
jgi:hypothetical protein